MNPTHYPYPAALVTAAAVYFGTTYTHYSTKHAEGYDLYLYHPDDPLQPKVMIREDVIHTPTIEAQAEATKRVIITEYPHGDWVIVQVTVCGKIVFRDMGKSDAHTAQVRENATYCAKSWHQELAHALFVYSEKREAAAKAEGAREERARCVAILNAQLQTAQARLRWAKERGAPIVQVNHYNGEIRAYEDAIKAINIVNQE